MENVFWDGNWYFVLSGGNFIVIVVRTCGVEFVRCMRFVLCKL